MRGGVAGIVSDGATRPSGRATSSSHRVRGTGHAHDRRPAGAHQARPDQPHHRGAADRAQDPPGAVRRPPRQRDGGAGAAHRRVPRRGQRHRHHHLPGRRQEHRHAGLARRGRRHQGPVRPAGQAGAHREDRHRGRHRRRLRHRGAAPPAHRAPGGRQPHHRRRRGAPEGPPDPGGRDARPLRRADRHHRRRQLRRARQGHRRAQGAGGAARAHRPGASPSGR